MLLRVNRPVITVTSAADTSTTSLTALAEKVKHYCRKKIENNLMYTIRIMYNLLQNLNRV